MRLVLAIASHIRSEEQLTLMKYALQSIANCSIKPDHVYVSWSGLIDIDLEEIIQGYSTFVYHNCQKFQFEHYKYIFDTYITDNDLVSFMDDDDYIHPDKFKWLRDKVYVDEFSGELICSKSIRHSNYLFHEEKVNSTCIEDIKAKLERGFSEYVNYSITKNMFNDAMKQTITYKDIKYETFDLMFIICLNMLYEYTYEDVPLYYYRRNKFSVRGLSDKEINLWIERYGKLNQ